MPNLDAKLCTYYAFTDPASGKKGRQSTIKQSKQAITVVAVSPQTHIFAVFAWMGKLATTAYIKKLLQVHKDYSPKIFGIEANAMQSLFADVVRDQAKKDLSKVTFLPISQPTNVDKKFRIRTTIEPVINYGRLFVLPSLIELDSGLRGFPAADEYLDLVDCFASTLKLVPRRAEAVAKNEELQELARYLRETGAPAWYIERRIQEAREAISRKPATSTHTSNPP